MLRLAVTRLVTKYKEIQGGLAVHMTKIGNKRLCVRLRMISNNGYSHTAKRNIIQTRLLKDSTYLTEWKKVVKHVAIRIGVYRVRQWEKLLSNYIIV